MVTEVARVPACIIAAHGNVPTPLSLLAASCKHVALRAEEKLGDESAASSRACAYKVALLNLSVPKKRRSNRGGISKMMWMSALPSRIAS